MASRIFSIRLDDTAVEALERVQSADDDSLNTTLKRVVLDALGIDIQTPINAINNNERLQDLIRQEVENALKAIASQEYFQKAVNTPINICTQNQNYILIDSEFRLEKLEESTQELHSLLGQTLYSPVKAETTLQDVVFTQASKPLIKEQIKTKTNSIARTFKNKGLQISLTIIKNKILELYPNCDDWISNDARLDVIRALEKQHS